MILGDVFNYRFIFERVQDFEVVRKRENYFGSRFIGESLYSIILEGEGTLDKKVLNNFLEEVTPSLEELVEKDPEFSERIILHYRGNRAIDYSYN